MRFKLPYGIWTAVAIILFAIVAMCTYQRSELTTPQAMTRLVSEKLQEQQQSLDGLLKNEAVIKKMFSDRLSAAQVEDISQKPFYIYAFEDKDVLLFWNSNIVVSSCDTLAGITANKSLYEKNGFYLKQCIRLPFLKQGQYLVALFPIVKQYPFDNEYLQSGFAAAEYIPLSTEVAARKIQDSYTVTDKAGQPLFYLKYDRVNLPQLPPSRGMVLLLAAGLLFLFIEIHLIAIRLSRLKPFAGLLPIIGFCLLLIGSINPVSTWLHLDSTHFFSPLYYASNSLYASLGHLLLHLLCYFWIVCHFSSQLLVHKQYVQKTYAWAAPQQLLLAVFITCLLIASALSALKLTTSIILDSRLDLDVSNFYGIDGYAVVTIIMLTLLPVLLFSLLFTLNKLARSMVSIVAKYAILCIAILLCFLFKASTEVWIVLTWLMLMLTLALLDARVLSRNRLSSFEKMLTCCLFLAISFTPLVRHLLDEKEESNRLNFVWQAVANISARPTAMQTGANARGSLYPELLQDQKDLFRPTDRPYTYAVYRNTALVYQTSDHPFPFYLRNDTLGVGSKSVFKREDYHVLRYKADPQTTVSIIDRKSPVIIPLTTFSILLIAMLLACAMVAVFHYLFLLLQQREAPSFRVQLSFRVRIYMAILSLVLLSFMAIGVTTWFIFNNRNESSNKVRLRANTYAVERQVQQYLNQQRMQTTYAAFNSLADSAGFRDFINSLSQNRGVDVNVYDSLGTVIASSQDDIYNSNLLAGIMNPDAYHTLAEEEKAVFIQNENISKLNYMSCYVPLRNEYGKAYGYLNIPFLASGRELSFQISNVLVALIDVYVFMLIVSIGAAFFISNRLTKGLRVITEHFERYSAADNKPIDWAHDDEIGLMVEKYNATLAKVQEAAEKLAKSERESAWREMARQVAHEIKNPLTPMKLNIQYLQLAVQRGGDNVLELTGRTAASLLEQIENLSHIASAFSDFARMPEAAPEAIDLADLLQKAVALYHSHQTVSVTLQAPTEPLVVFADYSQMLRVFNNLLQNAVDAIPDERKGVIEVTLIKDGGEAMITIADNGSGIAEDVVPKIFSPYFTTKGSGTGLGLAMTKKIIEFWKGSITFETAEGKGTTFFIRLSLLHQ